MFAMIRPSVGYCVRLTALSNLLDVDVHARGAPELIGADAAVDFDQLRWLSTCGTQLSEFVTVWATVTRSHMVVVPAPHGLTSTLPTACTMWEVIAGARARWYYSVGRHDHSTFGLRTYIDGA